jgi:rhodanese-related sulfurtransferase
MGFFSSLLGGSNNSEVVKEMLAKDAVVVDVRSPGEFQGGHVAGSINIPLQSISGKVNELKAKNKPLVLCCASGNRSGQAERVLKNAGLECINGGSWMSVNACV